jgi:hypothetical protein
MAFSRYSISLVLCLIVVYVLPHCSKSSDNNPEEEVLPGENEPDTCPDDPDKNEPGYCGCGTPEGSCCETIETGLVREPGAEYFVYNQPWSADLDLASLTPDANQIVLPDQDTIETVAGDPSFVRVKGYVKISSGDNYTFKAGHGDSAFNVITVNGQEVYRRNIEQAEAATEEIFLSMGFHPFEIIYFKTATPLSIHINGGRMKATHLWHDEGLAPETQETIVNALRSLRLHVVGEEPLTETELQEHRSLLDENYYSFGADREIMTAATDLVASYDEKIGPLWINDHTKGGFDRRDLPNDIHTTTYFVMQAIMDHVYTDSNVGRCASLLDGIRFQSSDFFPGRVTSTPDPSQTHHATINGSFAPSFGHPFRGNQGNARRPTGTYLAPGTIATVTVPESMVNKGYMIRVGSHSWDMSKRPWIKRLDRSSLVFNIAHRRSQIASPIGGGIYIEVPLSSDAGIVEVAVDNAVRSPYFSAKDFDRTSLEEWRNTERHHGAPWADFQSEKFMMNVPTSWIYALDDPETLLNDWDRAMDTMNDLMGFPRLRDKETLYPQVDLLLRVSAHSPGYPSVNTKYDPDRDYDGLANSHLVRGPQFAPSYEFHEQGHEYLCVKYGGETESTVNLLHVAVMHQQFGMDLDTAFRTSRGVTNEYRTLNNTAVAWMTSFNFSPREVPMASGEKAYQLKGHAKYVDIAKLFGWEALNAFWYSINEDYENGIIWSKHGTPIDEITLRMSEVAEVDLRPLLHFWGIHPSDFNSLATAISAGNLPPSAEIYDRLMEYKSLVPANNAEFQAFALAWWEKQPSIDGYWTESEHARQWDNQSHEDRWSPPERPNGEIYDENAAAAARARVQEIIDLYFPQGRP